MRKLIVAVVVGVSALTAACGNVEDSSKPEKFRTVWVDGVKCIAWQPFTGDGAGASLQCDFSEK